MGDLLKRKEKASQYHWKVATTLDNGKLPWCFICRFQQSFDTVNHYIIHNCTSYYRLANAAVHQPALNFGVFFFIWQIDHNVLGGKELSQTISLYVNLKDKIVDLCCPCFMLMTALISTLLTCMQMMPLNARHIYIR